MGAIDNFMKRWGFARLSRYGLILTPEGRVLSTRPAVLDDGLGGRIVGWLEGDLAAMELEHWGESKPNAPKPIAMPKLAAPKPAAPKPAAPAAPKPAPPKPAAAPKPLPGVAPIAVVEVPVPRSVEAEPPVDEDEWEWEIAMARARAAEAEVEEARVDLLGAQAVIASAVITRKTTPGMMAVLPSPRPEPKHDPMANWPKTEPYNESMAEKTAEIPPEVLSPLQKTMLVEKRTVIPVPTLGTVSDPRALRPVIKSAPLPRVARPIIASQPPRRYARGTARQEETIKTKPVLANDDKTSPYIELPPEVNPPSGFAHTKRVAAK